MNLTPQDFSAYRVTNPEQSEVVRGRLYDYQLYPAAGVAQMSFFAAAIGQGITSAVGAVVGSPKTKWDTNLQVPNTLPSGKAFRIETVEIVFFPGTVSTANTYTLAPPNLFAAAAAAALVLQNADVETFYQSGLCRLNVLDKVYVEETPSVCFPPQTGINVTGAIASNSATTAAIGFQKSKAAGNVYALDPYITLQPAVNFAFTIDYPAAVAMPSGFNARVGVILDGHFIRASQ